MIFFNTWQEEKQVEHKMRNRKPVSGGVEVVGRGAPPPMFPLAEQMDLGLSVKLSFNPSQWIPLTCNYW